MKWSDKGHELDKYGEKLVQDFRNKEEKIFIFGAGLLGEEYRPLFEKLGCFAGYIDNDRKKQESGVCGVRVLSLEEYFQEGNRGIIVIAADEKNIPAIKQQLCRAGLKEREDFYTYMNFMKTVYPVLSTYFYNQFYVELAQICLTERCSLKCKACAHACYAVDAKSPDMSLEMAEESADSFFGKVDLIKEFVLIGGEPFLYKELDKIIAYIGERYRDKMITFAITTNGTIMPAQSVLDLCRKYRVLIRISNYSAELKYLKKKYARLKEELERNKITYILGGSDYHWMDYGFETLDRGGKEEELIRVFDRCKTPCREIRGSRYYYCVMARSVSDNLGFGLGKEDYLDLEKIGKEDKKVLLEFEMGYSDKGYLEMCNHCNGADAVNHPLPVAEQLPR